MEKVLLVRSSIFGEKSKSLNLAREFLGRFPHGSLVERVLTADSMPHLTAETYVAMGTPEAELTGKQRAQLVLSDALIAEIESADTIVLAVPLYNFSIPSTLKAWIDHIARRGRTFSYTAAGPQGLLKGKKVFVLTSRGGVYSEGPAQAFDFQAPYLRAVLGLVGLTDVAFVHFEGIGISPEAAKKGFDRALLAIDEIVGGPRAAA